MREQRRLLTYPYLSPIAIQKGTLHIMIELLEAKELTEEELRIVIGGAHSHAHHHERRRHHRRHHRRNFEEDYSDESDSGDDGGFGLDIGIGDED